MYGGLMYTGKIYKKYASGINWKLAVELQYAQ